MLLHPFTVILFSRYCLAILQKGFVYFIYLSSLLQTRYIIEKDFSKKNWNCQVPRYPFFFSLQKLTGLREEYIWHYMEISTTQYHQKKILTGSVFAESTGRLSWCQKRISVEASGFTQGYRLRCRNHIWWPRLRFHFTRIDKLPKEARNVIISIIEPIMVFLETNEM